MSLGPNIIMAIIFGGLFGLSIYYFVFKTARLKREKNIVKRMEAKRSVNIGGKIVNLDPNSLIDEPVSEPDPEEDIRSLDLEETEEDRLIASPEQNLTKEDLKKIKVDDETMDQLNKKFKKDKKKNRKSKKNGKKNKS